jgi:hypothetical protein
MSSTALGRCALLLLFVGLVTTVADAAETLSTIKSEGSTELTYKTPSGNILRVEIWQTKLERSFPYKDALLWGGDVGEPPQTVSRKKSSGDRQYVRQTRLNGVS